jgi:peptide/nickel transport system permease protein
MENGWGASSREIWASLCERKDLFSIRLLNVTPQASTSRWLPCSLERSWDYSAMGFALFGIAVPNFWFALLLILGFGLYLGWFPTLGYVDPSVNFLMFLWHLTLPTIVLGTDMASTVTRYVRAEMLEQLKLDYVRTARAKGLPPRLVVYKHTLKNSLISAITVIGLHIGRLLGGSTVIETVFAWPGVARLVLEAVYARDYPVLQGSVLLLVCTYVGVNLIVDILYKWLDPRISLK